MANKKAIRNRIQILTERNFHLCIFRVNTFLIQNELMFSSYSTKMVRIGAIGLNGGDQVSVSSLCRIECIQDGIVSFREEAHAFNRYVAL